MPLGICGYPFRLFSRKLKGNIYELKNKIYLGIDIILVGLIIYLG